MSASNIPPGYVAEPGYPHVVIRYMAAAYGRVELVFRSKTAPANGCSAIAVDAAAPPPGEPMSAETRAAVLEATHALVKLSRMRCCAVFSPCDVVFCEPGGVTVTGTEPPSGGIRYDRVMNTVTAPKTGVDNG